MHPVFSRKGALGPYLAAWVPLAVILAAILALPGQITWGEAFALAVPLALLYAVIGLSSWYVCRAAPLGIAGLIRLVVTHAVAAVALSGLWLGLGWGAASLLVRVPSWEDLPDRLAPGMPVLWAVGILFYLLSIAFHYLLVAFEASGAAERREGDLRLQAREAELRALKAQVNPHFLFNSLNSISALAGSDAARAREMCVLLSDFLRMSLGMGERDRVTLGEELDLAGTFLGVEKVRLGSRLTVEMDVETGCRTCPVIPLLLQPLVENAVIHGIAKLTEGGVLRIEARRAGDRLRLGVENPYDPGMPSRRGGGLGLANVRRRLAARYGGEARLEIDTKEGRYRVVLNLPVRDGEG